MTANNIKKIDVNELKKRMDANPELCLIDVRENDEWQESHIPGAIHIPKDQITDRIESTTPERNQTIYLHCKGGVRSLYAAERLHAMGYEDIYSINGGIADWVAKGYPVVK